jgi:hypothetical protein
MNRLTGVGVVAVLFFGCASSTDAIARRDAVRKYNAAASAPVDVATYRSSEGVRNTSWGMTEDEVIARKGPPAQRGPGLLMFEDAIDGVPVPSTWAFFEGHLAQVKSRFEADRQNAGRVEAALGQKYGTPVSVFDKANATAEALETARRWDIATSLLSAGVSVGTTHAFPSYGLSAADRDLLRTSLKNAPRPARDAVWTTKETNVHLVVLEGGVAEVTWGSRSLAPRLVRSLLSEAGLGDLARDL